MRKKQGFTIIELLIVIAIIALIATITMSSLKKHFASLRDTIRKSDFNNIAQALEIYYTAHGSYPKTSDSADENGNGQCSLPGCIVPGWIPELVTDGLFKSVPVDPLNIPEPYDGSVHGCTEWTDAEGHWYSYTSDGKHYILCTWLENANDREGLWSHCLRSPWRPNDCLNWWGYDDNAYVVSQ